MLLAGSTAIVGWTVIGAGIDYLGPPWDVSDGLRAIDLDGSFKTGGIEQTFATLVNQAYTVSFDLSGNPQGPSRFKQMRVSAGGFTNDDAFDSFGQRLDALVWESISFSFLATNTTSTLSFVTFTSGQCITLAFKRFLSRQRCVSSDSDWL